MESLSSFIGIDGTNTTLNSGRIQINLKPLEERKISASDVIRRLQPELAQVAGITLYMQPVQDLTVEDRVSRTQFQYTLEDPNADELNHFAPQMVEKLQAAAGTARCGERPADGRAAREAGVRPRHRVAAGHHAVDDRQHALRRLRAAPGLDDVHAAEPVSRGAGSEAGVPAGPRRTLRNLFIRTSAGGSTGGVAESVVAEGRPRTAGFGPSSASSASAAQRPARPSTGGRSSSAVPNGPASFVAGVFRQREPGAARARSRIWR